MSLAIIQFYKNLVQIIRKIFRKAFTRTGVALQKSGKRIYIYPQEERIASWLADNGDNTLWLDHDELNENSVILDVGGYEGRFAAEMLCRYNCKEIHIFEPVPEYAELIKKRFRRNSKVLVHAFGLADANETVPMGIANDGSSVFKPGESTEQIHLVRAADFIRENDIKVIDMMKINIEGCEYDLLDHLINSGATENITNIQVQFHPFVPDAEARMQRIHDALRETHALTYQYPFVWENWKKRN